MNSNEIKKYVADYLIGKSNSFFQEIIDHGVYNTCANIVDAETDDEYLEIADEFKLQAKELLRDA